MAKRGLQLSEEKFYCWLCEELLRDPVTVPCGHSYCMCCIRERWDREEAQEEAQAGFSCPQCGKVFRPRPALVENSILADLVGELRKTGLQAASHREALQENVGSHHHKVQQQRIQLRLRDVAALQREAEAIERSADAAVQRSRAAFEELRRLLERRGREAEERIRCQQQAEVRRVEELQAQLREELQELHAQPEDSPRSTLLPGDAPWTSRRSPKYFEEATAAVVELQRRLQDVLSEEWKRVCASELDVLLTPAEPKTRAEFLHYARRVTLDPNTLNKRLLLSHADRRVVFVGSAQPYADHPERFADRPQVLSGEALTGRCYWEVEWSGSVSVAVSYRSISRSGRESGFGHNGKSWSLYCHINQFLHNSITTQLAGAWSPRVGVYLDHKAGVLAFYRADAMALLHRVQTTFTQPLHAGLFVGLGSSAEIL